MVGRKGGKTILRALTLIPILLSVTIAAADTIRVATYNVSLGRRGPGVLLKDIMSNKDTQIPALVSIIQQIHPDVLLLTEFDHDHTNLALNAFSRSLAAGEAGISYPYIYAPAGNEGVPSFLDLNDNGKSDEWGDAFGFGRFPGSEGMALLSRFPIKRTRSFAQLGWNGPDFLPPETAAALRLSSKSHWDVEVIMPNNIPLNILASHPTPPVFDDERDLNGLRNDAEIAFWVSYLDGDQIMDDSGNLAPFGGSHFVLLGDLNNDPIDGEGHKFALHALLSHPLINDPAPQSDGAIASAGRQGGANDTQQGNPAFDTVDWGAEIGNMRVDYALPSVSLTTLDSGVFWPLPDAPYGDIIGEGHDGATNHRLVWVDLLID